MPGRPFELAQVTLNPLEFSFVARVGYDRRGTVLPGAISSVG